MARDHQQLEVFQLAHQLVLDVYRLTEGFPIEERYGILSQLRRAALSIPTNIAEGCARRGARDYARFVDIAVGSAAELRYLLDLSVDLGFLSSQKADGCRKRSECVVRTLKNLRTAVTRFES
jgi:four helix bundle protein